MNLRMGIGDLVGLILVVVVLVSLALLLVPPRRSTPARPVAEAVDEPERPRTVADLVRERAESAAAQGLGETGRKPR